MSAEMSHATHCRLRHRRSLGSVTTPGSPFQRFPYKRQMDGFFVLCATTSGEQIDNRAFR
jgi:hypothetical protein